MRRPSRRSQSTVAGRERSASFGAAGPFGSRSVVFARLSSAGAVAAISLSSCRVCGAKWSDHSPERTEWYYHSPVEMGGSSAKLVAQGVVVEYWLPRSDTLFTAVEGVDLEIRDGEFVAIVRPSGWG